MELIFSKFENEPPLSFLKTIFEHFLDRFFEEQLKMTASK